MVDRHPHESVWNSRARSDVARAFPWRAVGCLALVWVVCNPARAANFVVTSTADDGSVGTLRWAVAQANAAGAGTHNITFSLPANSTITLGSSLSIANPSGNIVVNGSGTAGLTISGGAVDPFLQASPVATRSVSLLNVQLSGTGGLTKTGGGTLTRSGNGLYTGDTRINEGTLSYGTAGAIRGDSEVYIGDGVGPAASASLDINASMLPDQAFDAHLAADGRLTQLNNRIVRLQSVEGASGELRMAAVGNLFAITGTGPDANFGGLITGGVAANSFDPNGGSRLLKTGGSIQSISGANTYVARTFITDGALRISHDQALGATGANSATFVFGSGSLELAGGITTAERIYLNGLGFQALGALKSASGANTVSGQVTLGWSSTSVTPSTVAIGAETDASLSLTGLIDGTQNLEKRGGGVVSFDGTTVNSYTGSTTVRSGQLRLNRSVGTGASDFGTSIRGPLTIDALGSVLVQQNEQISDSAAVTLRGGTLDLGSATETIDRLFFIDGGSVIGSSSNLLFDSANAVTTSGSGLATVATPLGLISSSPTSTGPRVFQIGADAPLTISGAIGDGAAATAGLDKSGAGRLTLLGQNSYSGGTRILAGELAGNTQSLRGVIQNSGTAIFDQSTDDRFSGSIAGTGALIKTGAGRLELNGAAGLTGTTTIQQGELALPGDLGSAQVIVEQSARLTGSGTIAGTLRNSGNVAPGPGLATLRADRFEQDSTGTLEIEIDASGNSDRLVVASGAALTGGAVQVRSNPGTYARNKRYDFLLGSVTGQFDSITDDLAVLSAVLGYDANGVYFTLVSDSTWASFGDTPNQIAFGNYLDGLDATEQAAISGLIDELDSLSEAEARAAFDQLDGSLHGTLSAIGIQNTTLIIQLINDRIAARRLSADRAGRVARTNDRADSMQIVYVSRRDRQHSDLGTQGHEVWAEGFGWGGLTDGDGVADGTQSGTGGILLGVDGVVDDRTLWGLFGGYIGSSVEAREIQQRGEIAGGVFGGYARHDLDVAYLSAVLGLQSDQYDIDRAIRFGNTAEVAKAAYDGWQGFSYLESGLDLPFGHRLWQPYLGLQYAYLRHDRFEERGADEMNLLVSGADADSLRTFLGTRLFVGPRGEGWSRIAPRIQLAWMHELLNPESTVDATFIPIGAPGFQVRGLGLGRDAAIFGYGVDWMFGQHVAVRADYDVLFNSRQTIHAGSGGLEFAW